MLFPDLIAQVRPLAHRPIHVHLMVSDDALMDQIDQFADAGADIISLHAENAIQAGLDRIRARASAGLVLQLHAPVTAVASVLDGLSILTLLTKWASRASASIRPQNPASPRPAR